MTLLAPERLLLLVPVVLAVAGYALAQRRRRRHAVRFTRVELLASVAPSSPGWRRHVTAAVGIAAMGALVLALAQPVVERSVARDRAVVVVVVDVSLSMEATDVQPSRIAAARTAATAFVEGLPDTFAVGVVAYCGTVQVVAPPTTDHDVAVDAIASLTTVEGTATGEALAASLDAIRTALAAAGLELEPSEATAGALRELTSSSGGGAVRGVPATIVLLSDGASAEGRPVAEVADEAAALGVPVSTITYGTPGGTVTVDGETIAVPPDPATMAALAEATGGTAFVAASGQELTGVYEDVEAQVGRTVEEQEVTLAVVALGLLLLLASFGLGLTWSGRVF